MNYFIDCYTVFDVKRRFRDLAMANHPDMGGDNETMRIILEQYHVALQLCNGQVSKDEQGQDHVYNYNADSEQAIVDKIQEVLKIRMEGVDIALIGLWVWVNGNTRPYKEELKKAGFCFHGKRSAWYWKPYKGYTKYNHKASLGDLANKYGYKRYENEQDNSIV